MPIKKHKRVLLKLSGEFLSGGGDDVVDGKVLIDFAKTVKKIVRGKVRMGIVVGGGNIWRFRDNKNLKLDRVASDTMGMIATIMNALALENALKQVGVPVKAMSNLPCEKALETYTAKKAREYMDAGNVLIFAGGTGNPFFTTDSAAALKALEMDCEVLLKATNVDYVYDKDPHKHKNAKKFTKMKFDQILEQNLGVMDASCASLCRDGGIKMVVFNFAKKGNLEKAVKGAKIGTQIN